MVYLGRRRSAGGTANAKEELRDCDRASDAGRLLCAPARELSDDSLCAYILPAQYASSEMGSSLM